MLLLFWFHNGLGDVFTDFEEFETDVAEEPQLQFMWQCNY